MKIAVLGTGFGMRHVEIYKKIEEVSDIVVWGRNEDKLHEIREKFGVETTTDLDEIWSDNDICMVDVCMPTSLHCSIGVKSIESGKDVFIDLFMNHEASYEYLSSIAKEEKLGKCKQLNVKRLTPPWWGNLSTDNIALNLMHHDIDYVLQLLGEPSDINVSSLDVKENQSVVTVSFEYKDCYATIVGSSAMPGTAPFSVGYEALFENGYVKYDENAYSDGRFESKLDLFTEEKQKEIKLPMSDCYENVCRDVINSIIENKPSLMDGNKALLTLETIFMINNKMKRE